MSILALYQHPQLQQPTKVLTHDEDILPQLNVLGVAVHRLEWPQQRAVLDAEAIPELPSSLVAGGSMAYRSLQRWPVTPAYAERFEGPIDPEQYLAAPSWWLLAEGSGALCISHAEQLLVLHCNQPLLLGLPASLCHWFVPSAGRACAVLRLARKPADLALLASGRDVAKHFEPLDL